MLPVPVPDPYSEFLPDPTRTRGFTRTRRVNSTTSRTRSLMPLVRKYLASKSFQSLLTNQTCLYTLQATSNQYLHYSSLPSSHLPVLPDHPSVPLRSLTSHLRLPLPIN